MADQQDESVTPDSERVALTDERFRAAMDGPAIYSNRMILSLMDGGVRIAFMEQLGDAIPARFRTCVYLSARDALALRDLISRNLKEFEEAFNRVKKAAESEEHKEDGS